MDQSIKQHNCIIDDDDDDDDDDNNNVSWAPEWILKVMWHWRLE